ncbi:hypothetical protein ACFP1I_11960 [Dyadobacter subterraneus]|uniref:Uncharacterized protein n=1 Tax=Dyadobacter subterraneus TaxID=2773304 RepID=A0ABR9WDT3_9BACT|nr:hypothetical protein [Dyadobacter subterraneus]MBE9463640.1 hypothetical protein [Dyadobacter subterraneus]
MQTEFELLIEELESEKSRLDEELQECLQSKNYKYAQYFQKGIWRVQRKIEQLKKLNRNPLIRDTQYLADAINELNNDVIEGFSLFFLKDSDFYLHFYKLPDSKLYCQIPTEDEMLKAYYYAYRPDSRKYILSLGFELNEKKPGVVFSVEDNQSCDEILTKLAVLMFDILYISTEASGYITKKILK